jgi:hypothetical protein
MEPSTPENYLTACSAAGQSENVLGSTPQTLLPRSYGPDKISLNLMIGFKKHISVKCLY